MSKEYSPKYGEIIMLLINTIIDITCNERWAPVSCGTNNQRWSVGALSPES